MSDIAVRAENLSKVYTLYPTPWDRMRDLFGWKRRGSAEFPTHTAIDGIDLEIRFGEKVGFIGRNGAGKSTLLKLITGVIEPTGGRLEVNGDTHALLQMGVGFHQDFTGRENAYGYLANLGLTGERADEAVDEIIEFSELEEYIDQPLKTYSTGMAMRLIFAASTTVAPKLYVVDEVLGVGDAYFQQKSFARIKEMVTKNQTTLLLVSHDIYSMARICERIIWIDRGRIKFDGDPKTALNVYEKSIKEQEEQRLRRKAMLPSGAATHRAREGWATCLLELRAASGKPLQAPVSVLEARLIDGDQTLAVLERDGGSHATARLDLVHEGSSWGFVEDHSEVLQLKNYGSTFQKGVMRASASDKARLERLRLSLLLESEMPQELVVALYSNELRPLLAGRIALDRGARSECRLSLDPAGLEEIRNEAQQFSERHGSGAVRLTDVELLDETGTATRRLRQGRPFTVEFGYRLVDPKVADDLEVILAVSREGVLDCLRAFCPNLTLPARQMSGSLRFRAASMPLANGTFVISILIAKRGYYEINGGKPFGINDDVYDVVSRAIEFNVIESHPAYLGTIVECQGQWVVETSGETDANKSLACAPYTAEET